MVATRLDGSESHDGESNSALAQSLLLQYLSMQNLGRVSMRGAHIAMFVAGFTGERIDSPEYDTGIYEAAKALRALLEKPHGSHERNRYNTTRLQTAEGISPLMGYPRKVSMEIEKLLVTEGLLPPEVLIQAYNLTQNEYENIADLKEIFGLGIDSPADDATQ